MREDVREPQWPLRHSSEDSTVSTEDAADRTRHRSVWHWMMWGGAALVLLVPLTAMQFTSEVDWSPMDFVVMAVMLAAMCGGFELATRVSPSIAFRAAAAIAVTTAFVLAWINLAVGIIGSEANPANLMYAGVLGVGLLGVLLAGARPLGLSYALLATALAQAIVAGVVLVGRLGVDASVLTLAFIAPWLLSAWLFRRAAAGR